MPKSDDPFIVQLWEALVEAKLPPGGHAETWKDAPVRIRNRFTKAARQAMQSKAAFGAVPLSQVESFASGASGDRASRAKKKRASRS